MASRITGRIQSAYAKYKNSRSIRDQIASELITDTEQQRIPEAIDDELYTGDQMRQIHMRGTLNSPEGDQTVEKKTGK